MKMAILEEMFLLNNSLLKVLRKSLGKNLHLLTAVDPAMIHSLFLSNKVSNHKSNV